MKLLLTASAAISILASQAHAGDSAHDWAGSYIGAQIGYANSTLGLSEQSDFSGNHDKDAFIGGVYIGHDWQFGDFVYGVTGDIDYVAVDQAAFGDEDIFTGGKGESYTYDIDWVASARLRAGFAATDRVLMFVSGGPAVGHVKAGNYYRQSDDGDLTFGGADKIQFGVAFGGGAEFAINSKWTSKVEVLHYAFDDFQTDGPGGLQDVKFEPSLTTVKLGLAYHF